MVTISSIKVKAWGKNNIPNQKSPKQSHTREVKNSTVYIKDYLITNYNQPISIDLLDVIRDL